MSSPPMPGARPVAKPVPQTAARCVSCSSRLDPAEDWCSLCLTLRGAIAQPAAAAAAPVPAAPAVQPVTAETAAAETAAVDPEREPAAGRPADQDEIWWEQLEPRVKARVEELLAELAVSEARHNRETRLGLLQVRLGLLTGTRGALIAISFGLALLVLIVLGLTLLGMAL